MKTVAFLQNQWVRDPERVRRAIALAGAPQRYRRRFIACALFNGCLTGRRIVDAFGEVFLDRAQIIWENASPQIASKASGAFPPDVDHMAAVLKEEQPVAVLLFGAKAIRGYKAAARSVGDLCAAVFSGPHPAARRVATRYELHQMAKRYHYWRAVQSRVPKSQIPNGVRP